MDTLYLLLYTSKCICPIVQESIAAVLYLHHLFNPLRAVSSTYVYIAPLYLPLLFPIPTYTYSPILSYPYVCLHPTQGSLLNLRIYLRTFIVSYSYLYL